MNQIERMSTFGDTISLNFVTSGLIWIHARYWAVWKVRKNRGGNVPDLPDPRDRIPSFSVKLSNPVVISGRSPVRRLKPWYCLRSFIWYVVHAWPLKDACILGYLGSATWRSLCLSYRETTPIIALSPALSGKVRVVLRVRSARVAYHCIGWLGSRQVRSSFSISTAIKRARRSINNWTGISWFSTWNWIYLKTLTTNTPAASATISKPPETALPLTIAFWDLQVRKAPINRV